MPLPSKDKIAGFDFEKNVVMVKTDKRVRLPYTKEVVSVHEILPLTDEDKEVICDAWLDWRYRQK